MTLKDKIEDIMWDNIHSDRGYVKGIAETTDIIMGIIRDNITLEWESWYFGDAFAVTNYGTYNTRDGEWREPRKRTKWHKSDNPRAAALEHYRNTIMSEIGG